MTRLVSLLTVVVLALAMSVARGGEPEDSIAKAEALLAAVHVNEAISAFEAVLAGLEADPKADPLVVARVHSGLGRALVTRGDAYAALQHFEAAVKHRGTSGDRLDYADALLAVAQSNMAAGQPNPAFVAPYLKDAEEAARATAMDDAVAPRRCRILGQAAHWLGREEEAVALWKEAHLEDLPPEEGRYDLELLARSLYDLKRFAESAEAYRAAKSRRGEASAWAAAKEAKKSLDLYAALVREDPEDAAVLDDALSAARFTGGHAMLAEALSGIQVTGPAHARILRARGLLSEMAGDVPGALKLLEAAAADDPVGAAPLVDRGRILLSSPGAGSDAVGPAVDAYLEALRREPTNEAARSALWYLAGQDYADLWRAWPSRESLDRCVRIQRAVLAADPSDALLWGNLGNTLRVGGDARGATLAYERALTENPYDPSLWSDSGLARSAGGDAAGALAAFEKSIAMDAGHVAGRQNAGRALHLAGEDVRARSQFAAALSTSRTLGTGAMLFRAFLDRSWRAGAAREVR